jgi:hypothetical protein
LFRDYGVTGSEAIHMSDNNKNDMLKSLVRSSCRPVQASPVFRKKMINQLLQEKAVSTAGTLHIFGLSPVPLVVLVVVIAIAMVVYGVLSVPDPSGIIYSAPLPPIN